MLINASHISLASEHALDAGSATLLRVDETAHATSPFGRIFEDQLQAPPAQLLQIETPAAPAPPPADPLAAIMALLFGLPPVADGATAAVGHPAAAPATDWSDARSLRLIQTSVTESCSFAASGNICLADGSRRQFDVAYRMERSEQSTELDIGAAFKDPLMLDLAAPVAALGRHSVDFDLDGDGKTERMRMPTGDSAVLFIDRNHNGRADDGSELFGPRSGNGFAELARLDGDGNGWIDGGDAAYADLALWRVGDDGASRVETLAAAAIGALATASAPTPFTLKEHGAAIGQVRASSVWLGENGGAGIVRQIDVATAPDGAQNVR